MRTLVVVLVLSSFLALASPAYSGTIAAEYALDNWVTFFSQSYTHGWEFTALTDLTVDGLAVWDEASDGLAGNQTVKLWTIGGALLASAFFTAGDTANLSDFVVAPIAPVSLMSGSTYVISTYMTGANERIGHFALSGPLISHPGISVNTCGRRGVNADNFPTLSFVDYGAPMGASFTVTAIPEPGSLALTGLGGLALGLAMLRRRRRARS